MSKLAVTLSLCAIGISGLNFYNAQESDLNLSGVSKKIAALEVDSSDNTSNIDIINNSLKRESDDIHEMRNTLLKKIKADTADLGNRLSRATKTVAKVAKKSDNGDDNFKNDIKVLQIAIKSILDTTEAAMNSMKEDTKASTAAAIDSAIAKTKQANNEKIAGFNKKIAGTFENINASLEDLKNRLSILEEKLPNKGQTAPVVETIKPDSNESATVNISSENENNTTAAEPDNSTTSDTSATEPTSSK